MGINQSAAEKDAIAFIPKLTVAGLVLIVLATSALAQTPACMDFEPPLFPAGNQYGAPALNFPGQVVVTAANHIQMAVDTFKFIGHSPPVAFDVARIEIPPIPFATGQSIRTNNINLLFDFTSIGFIPQEVRFEFLEIIQTVNISVNGGVPFVGDLSKVPANLGGAAIAVAAMPVPPPLNGSIGKVTLIGPVFSLKIGGEEFWIDNVCAFPKVEKP